MKLVLRKLLVLGRRESSFFLSSPQGAGRGPTAAEAVATAATGFKGGGAGAGDGVEEAEDFRKGALPAPFSRSSPTPSSAIQPLSLLATASSIATALDCSASELPKVSLQASSHSDLPSGSARETAAQTVWTVEATPTSRRSGGGEVIDVEFLFALSSLSPSPEVTTTHSGPPESPGVTAQPV